MEIGRVTVAVVVAVVAVTAVASGPLVGAIDLTGASPGLSPPSGTGDAEVTVVTAPVEDYAFEQGRFGATVYHVDAPPFVVDVDDVEGNPTLRYTIDVRDAGFTTTREVDLSGIEGKRLRLRPGTAEISPQVLNSGSYEAQVAIWLRYDGSRYRQIYQKTVTITVEDG